MSKSTKQQTYKNVVYNEPSYKSELNNDTSYFNEDEMSKRIVALTDQKTIDDLVSKTTNALDSVVFEKSNYYFNPYFIRSKKFYALLKVEIEQDFVISTTVDQILSILTDLRISLSSYKKCDVCGKYEIEHAARSGHFYCDSCVHWMKDNSNKKLAIKQLPVSKKHLTRYQIMEMKDRVKDLYILVQSLPSNEKEFSFGLLEKSIALIKEIDSKYKKFNG